MQSLYSLIFLLVAILVVAQAKVHHHVVHEGGDHGHGNDGTIFDAAASVANGIL